MANKKEENAKTRIVEVTAELLAEVENLDDITIRQIAERAGIGVGLVNYHFKSRDNLLGIAVGEEMTEMIKTLPKAADESLTPLQKLRLILKQLCDFGLLHEKILQYMLKQNILKGEMGAQLMLVPLLKEVFASERDEMSLRILAGQIILPIQAAALAPEAFHLYSGIDIWEKEQRDGFVDMLINNLLGERRDEE